MSHSSLVGGEEMPVEVLFEQKLSVSTIEPPIEEWSSLIIKETPPESPKVVAFREGLYDPGSGEICTKYIPVSDSSVLRHVYYAYPRVKDPGIAEALSLPEPKHINDTDGQDLYLALCEEMNLMPVRKFHRSLVEQEIILKYYCVNPVGVRAMCMSMVLNKFVKRLDLTSNFLNDDACYHIGQLLRDNLTLDELVLAQCKIGPRGIRRVVANLYLRTMELLDVSSTGMGVDGFQYLANVFSKGGVIRRLNLSNNDLTYESGLLFADAIEFNNKITHLDISWNKLYTPGGSARLLRVLGESAVLTELNFSWNSLIISVPIQKLLTSRSLRKLDLSNNRLGNLAAKCIALRLPKAKKLHTLDLSYNPLGPDDAFLLLEAMKMQRVKLKNLLMADVGVSKEFMVELRKILELPYRENTTISYGHVIRNYTLSMPDLRRIVLKRLDFIFRGKKKYKADVVLWLTEECKARGSEPFIPPREILRFMKTNGVSPNEDLVDELLRLFPGPKLEKGGFTINLPGIVEYIGRLWPEKKLPPTPPPLPPPPPPKKERKKKKLFKI